MVIRLAHENDLGAILDIYSYYVDNTSFTFDYDLPSRIEFLKKIESSHSFIVAEESNVISGYAYAGYYRIKPAYQWLCESTIYLNPDKISKGIGRQLYEALIAILRRMGYMSVLAGITRPNPISVKFHESLGFEHAYSYKNIGYKFKKWHSVDWYRLDLRSFTDEDPPNIISNNELGREELSRILVQYSK